MPTVFVMSKMHFELHCPVSLTLEFNCSLYCFFKLKYNQLKTGDLPKKLDFAHLEMLIYVTEVVIYEEQQSKTLEDK